MEYGTMSLKDVLEPAMQLAAGQQAIRSMPKQPTAWRREKT